MQVVHTLVEARAALESLPRPQGLVPTMGYLHAGHLSLAERARAENAIAVATIFVNPTQFGPSEDFATYPRDMDRDLSMLQNKGVDLVFTPEVNEMYPPGGETVVTVGTLSRILEGAARPGHFDGVATVVTKLFNVMRPDRAYFGQKDAQQVMVIRRLVSDLRFPIEVIACPTVREPDGLALSSRNAYLSAEERQAALVLSRALHRVQTLFSQEDERDADRLRLAMRTVIEAEPRARIDYVSVADPLTLAELEHVSEAALASLAVMIGKTRLIDNTVLSASER